VEADEKMGYYIRVLALETRVLTLAELRHSVPKGQELNVETGEESDWSQLILQHNGGNEISLIERNPVIPGELGEEELKEFIEEVKDEKPQSAANWLVQFLPRIKAIYAFQLLSGTDERNGWAGVHALQNHIWSRLGGILQADLEGFSNEDGYHILWQFHKDHEGPWKMAVLGPDLKWIAFEMRLENPNHREYFLNGRVPPGVKYL